MDFDHAIAAHAGWKSKLSQYLKKPDGPLHAAEVIRDNVCDLGKWLHGEGKKFAGLPEYGAVLAEHARFHKAAASVVERANRGDRVAEETALGSKSDFASASTNVVKAIMALKTKAGAPVGA